MMFLKKLSQKRETQFQNINFINKILELCLLGKQALCNMMKNGHKETCHTLKYELKIEK